MRVGLLGCGVVGSAVARQLLEGSPAGAPGELIHVAVKHPHKPRRITLPKGMLTTDARGVATDPDVDVVIEVIGGIEPARSLIVAAIEARKSVITANKELLARYGTELFDLASEHGVHVHFEASVCGAVPIIRALRESLAGDTIDRMVGIVNGTTNYILSRMADEGSSFNVALARARELGFAEADSTADLEGLDAAAKLTILASLAFGIDVTMADIYREGITSISQIEIEAAARFGYVIKLLAVADRRADGISLRVHPALVPAAHSLAHVRGESNSVVIDAQAAGRLTFSGPGAGGRPTAGAVIGDLVSTARNGRAVPMERPKATAHRLIPSDEIASRYFLRLVGAEAAAHLAAAFERCGVVVHRAMPGVGQVLVETGPVTGPTLDRVVSELAKRDIVAAARLRIHSES